MMVGQSGQIVRIFFQEFFLQLRGRRSGRREMCRTVFAFYLILALVFTNECAWLRHVILSRLRLFSDVSLFLAFFVFFLNVHFTIGLGIVFAGQIQRLQGLVRIPVAGPHEL